MKLINSLESGMPAQENASRIAGFMVWMKLGVTFPRVTPCFINIPAAESYFFSAIAVELNKGQEPIASSLKGSGALRGAFALKLRGLADKL